MANRSIKDGKEQQVSISCDNLSMCAAHTFRVPDLEENSITSKLHVPTSTCL